ncbi:zinc finger, C3HC4 type [Opisthorchis viverrini]|uniref:Zinc finger, C3HC4 type n=1 Tax=Opisthorchis viverrini TaxID=6198 RepID=A0A1S8WL59_OPIVI|nr:zinc finger, C3HC4 type [Opisthorchis viverrini]
MFGEDFISSFFQTPFFEPRFPPSSSQRSCSTGRASNHLHERCSLQGPRDIFEQFSQAADKVFAAATRSFFREAEMLPRYFYPSYLRDPPPPTSTSVTRIGVTLNGDLTERRVDGFGSRPYRLASDFLHSNNDRVQIDRTRLQWYDSNTRRSLVPAPVQPASRAEPSGRLTKDELAKLPLSVYRVRKAAVNSSREESSGNTSFLSSTESSPVVPVGRNTSNVCSPGSAYLDPVSKTPTVVEIQPLQSTPTRGHPECEICLTEYRNKDQLRHLPCGHAFHKKCIDAWFNESSTCPKCRAGVRTGLKRLERNRNRSCASSRNAPVRAIRERTTTSVPVNNAPDRRQCRTDRPTQNQRSNPVALQSGTEGSEEVTSGSSFVRSGSPIPNERTRMANPGSPLYADDRTQCPVEPVDNRLRGNATASSSVFGMFDDGTIDLRPRNSNTIHRQTQVATEAEKSRVARRKAAEAAIRRAEQAERERLQGTGN